jgi:hypothetical protein
MKDATSQHERCNTPATHMKQRCMKDNPYPEKSVTIVAKPEHPPTNLDKFPPHMKIIADKSL